MLLYGSVQICNVYTCIFKEHEHIYVFVHL